MADTALQSSKRKIFPLHFLPNCQGGIGFALLETKITG
jgi:hypothetical protein